MVVLFLYGYFEFFYVEYQIKLHLANVRLTFLRSAPRSAPRAYTPEEPCASLCLTPFQILIQTYIHPQLAITI